MYDELKGATRILEINVVHIHIPLAAAGMDSFNAAVAGSVVLSEVARQRRRQITSSAG